MSCRVFPRVVVVVLLVALGGARARAETRAETRPDAQATPPRVAMLPIAGKGAVLAYDLQRIEAALREQVEHVRGIEVLPADFTLAQLEAARQMGLRCAGYDADCLAKLGIISEFDLLFVPIAEVTPEGFRLEAALIDVAQGREVRRAMREVATNDPLSPATRLLALEVLAPERFFSRLVLRVRPEGARVQLDGVDIGRSPLPRLEGVRPGPRRISASLPGHVPVERDAFVPAGTTVRLALSLAPEEERGLSPLAWGGGAVFVGGLGAMIGASAGALYFESVLRDPSRPAIEHRDAKTLGRALWTVALVSAVAAAGGGVAFTAGLLEEP